MLHLEENKKTIAFFGEFNAGKSSLINALLGKDILPVKPIPTHTPPVILNYGTSLKIQVITNDNIIQESNSLSLLQEPTDNPGSTIVKLWIDNPILKSGLQLVDSPGTNDIDKHYSDFSIDFYQKYSAGIDDTAFLIRNGAINKTTIEAIKKANHIKPVSFVIFTRPDDYNSADTKEIIDTMEITLAEMGCSATVFSISPKELQSFNAKNGFLSLFFPEKQQWDVEPEIQRILTSINNITGLLKEEINELNESTGRKHDDTNALVSNISETISSLPNKNDMFHKIDETHQDLYQKLESSLSDLKSFLLTEQQLFFAQNETNFNKLLYLLQSIERDKLSEVDKKIVSIENSLQTINNLLTNSIEPSLLITNNSIKDISKRQENTRNLVSELKKSSHSYLDKISCLSWAIFYAILLMLAFIGYKIITSLPATK